MKLDIFMQKSSNLAGENRLLRFFVVIIGAAVLINSFFVYTSVKHQRTILVPVGLKSGMEVSDSPVPSPGGGNATTVVSAEVPSLVELSSSDINRLVCPADIKDVIYSKEKGMVVRIAGRNAFVKFSIKKDAGKEVYSTTPTEIYIVCGEKVFTLIAVPKRIPSKTVMLSGEDDKAKKNISLFSGIPFEKKVLSTIRSVYTENIPDSFTVKEEHRPYDLYKGLKLTLRRMVLVEGEGVILKEFVAEVVENMEIEEKDFLKSELQTS